MPVGRGHPIKCGQRPGSPAAAHLGARLLLFLEMNAEEDGRTFIIRGDLQDIAAEIRLPREALYRGLARLACKGLIRREAGRIWIRR